MVGLISLQVAALAILLLISLFLGYSSQVLMSQFLGGVSYFFPTLIAVVFLKMLKPYPKFAGIGFIVSAGLKIVLALTIMVAIFLLYEELVFLPYFLGLLISSHLVFLLFLKVHRYGK